MSSDTITLFFQACHNFDLQTIKQLAPQVPMNTIVDEENCIIALFGDLTKYIEYNDDSCVDELICVFELLHSLGADINFRDSYTRTCFGLACDTNNIKLVKYLFHRGDIELDILPEADVCFGVIESTYGNDGPSDFSDYLFSNHDLLDKLTLPYDLMDTVLRRGDISYCYDLMKVGFDLDPDDICFDAFQELLEKGETDLIVQLLENGYHPDESDRDETTHLSHLCLPYGVYDLESIKLLIQHGADVDLKDRKGKTALDYAIMSRKYEIIEYLLKHYAEGTDVMECACMHGLYMFEMLDDHFEINYPHLCLLNACIGGHLDVVEILYERYPNLHPSWKVDYRSPFGSACLGSHHDIIKFLLKYNPFIGYVRQVLEVRYDKHVRDIIIKAGMLPMDHVKTHKLPQNHKFILACANGSLDVVKELLKENRKFHKY